VSSTERTCFEGWRYARTVREEGAVRQLVGFPLEGGGTVLVQVEEADRGPVTRGLGRDDQGSKVVQRTSQTFEEATASVTPAAQALIARLKGLVDAPDEIGLEFGVQLSAEAGAFIASVAAEANFKITMSWKG
jgi:hypothetical protein